MRIIKRVTVIFWSLLIISLVNLQAADNPWNELSNVQVPASQTLRGFGRVETEFSGFQNNSERVWVQTFRCENRDKAGIVVGKFLADLRLSEGSKVEELNLVGKEIPALVTREGAIFVGCREGAEARIISALSRKTLMEFLATRPEIAAGAISSASYPVYLDYFDRWGWGICGLGGLENYHDWMGCAANFDGKKGRKDPMEDIEFLAENKIRFSGWFSPLGMDCSDGLTNNVGTEWKFREAAKRGLPMFFSYSYGVTGGADWSARRFGEYMEKPADFLQSGWHGPNLHWKAQPHLSWYSTDAQRYMAADFMAKMRKYSDKPSVMSRMTC